MKHRNRIFYIGLVALVLTLASTALVSGTFAKYVTTASGTGTVTVAKWGVKINGDDFAVTTPPTTFDLAKTIEAAGDVVSDRIAPGTKGKFEFTYDTTNTEVDHQITATINKTGWYDQIKFYETAANRDAGTDALVFVNNEATLTPQTITASQTPKTGTFTIYWGWDFYVSGAVDGTDTALVKDGASPSYTLTATATVTQLDSTGNQYNPSP
jgi:hypothetical protein